ncbi:MAG: iron-sulfur cluster co-chaperone HscB C-terminal domain-containing protein [Saprospiraceae bacterium]
MDYFEFFGLPVSFQVDVAELQKRFYRYSRQYHPDFHTLADGDEQERMLEMSTLNNRAWNTLSNPDQRIRYILEMKGLVGDETNQPPIPQDFLMDMMDINEGLMELEFDFEAERYATLQNEVTKLESELEANIRPLLETWTETTGTDAQLQAVRDFYLKKRYLLRIRENLSKFAPA